jgi:predicted nucleic acid-binding protein
MILVDVNLLVYTWDRRAPLHNTAVRWLDTKLSGSALVGLPWECLLGFLRVVTKSPDLPEVGAGHRGMAAGGALVERGMRGYRRSAAGRS